MKNIIFATISFLLAGSIYASVAPTGLSAVNITDSSIQFNWIDNSSKELSFSLCTVDKSGMPILCEENILANTLSYNWTGRPANSSDSYVVMAVHADGVSVSNKITVKTTHSWSGDLKFCVNEALGYGTGEANNLHTPTRAELESVINLTCDVDSANPADISTVLDLKNVEILTLINGVVSGVIPSGLGQLANLTSLNFAGNQLSGEMPVAIGSLANLTSLNLRGNQLSGEIPAEIGNLANLTYLNFRENQLSGQIPAEIGNLSKLTHLYFRWNQLSGQIPVEIGDLSKLTQLFLAENQFSGQVPVEIKKLVNLTLLDFGENQLSGQIPVEIGELVKLTTLSLSGNQFSGEIPEEIVSLASLTFLSLNDNQLSGQIPHAIINLMSLSYLKLDNNCDLDSNDQEVVDFLDNMDMADSFNTSYQEIIASNSYNCVSGLIPVIHYLLF